MKIEGTVEAAADDGSPATEAMVLVVDDNIVLAEQLTDSLKNQGFHATYKTSAEDALEVVSSGVEICVIVLDINLPQKNGMMLVQEIRRRGVSPMPSIVIISGDSGADTVITAMRLSVIDYLIKPVKPSELFTAVERAFDRFFALRNQSVDSPAKQILSVPNTRTSVPVAISHIESDQRSVLYFLVTMNGLNEKWCLQNGIDYLQLQMLIELAWCRVNNRAVTVTGLISGMGCALATGHRRLRKLEEDGFVVRYGEAHDRRFCFLNTTPKTLELLEKIGQQFRGKFPRAIVDGSKAKLSEDAPDRLGRTS